MLEPLERVAISRNSDVQVVDSESISKNYMDKFPFLEHSENVALALQVCKYAGISDESVLSGMLKTNPDPGALVIWNLDFKGISHYFVNAFAANDQKSPLQIWNMLENRIADRSTCIFLNTRSDRRYRTKQLLNLVFNEIQPDLFIVRGDDLPKELNELIDSHENMEMKIFSETTKPHEIFSYFSTIDSQFIMGIGNIVGWGENFVSELKEYRV